MGSKLGMIFRPREKGLMELASVIILNWNGQEHLFECLEAVQRQSYPDFEVILVDNASRDGSVEFVKKHFGRWVRIIENESNRGYAGGNNVGIRAARGEYIALLNNDTRVDPDWLGELIRVLKERPECGLAAGKVLFYDRPQVIDNVGHIIYRDGTFRGRGRLEVDRGQYDRLEEVLSPSGCAFLVRRKTLEEMGLFDEDFFIYGDDAELSLRIRLGGWKAVYVPTAVVYHKYSASTEPYSPRKAFLVERNRVWLTLKYFPPRALLLSPFFAGFRLILQAYAVLVGKGAAGRFVRQYSFLSLLLILIKAQLAALAGFPRMWRKRREMNKLRKVSSREFYRWFGKYRLSARELALKE